MEFPKPAVDQYVESTAVVLGTLAVLQYFGIFSDSAGDVDLVYLLAVGLLFPLVTYLLTVLGANVGPVPAWDRMTRNGE